MAATDVLTGFLSACGVSSTSVVADALHNRFIRRCVDGRPGSRLVR